MKSILFLTKRSLKYRWKSVLLQIIAYALCVSFLAVQGLTVYSLFLSVKETRAIAHGMQDGLLVNADEHQLDQNKISAYGTISNFAQLKMENVYHTKLNIGYADETAVRLHHITMAEGKMPSQGQEIALEESALVSLRKNLKVGDSVSLCLEPYDSSAITKDFLIVGIIKDFSQSQWKVKKEESLLPSIYTSRQFFESSHRNVIQLNSIQLKNNVTAGDFFKASLVESGACDSYFINERTDGSMALEQNTMLAGLSVGGLSGLLGILLLLNIMTVTKKQRRKQLGLYRVAGMKRGEIYSVFLLQTGFQLFFSSIIGILAGTQISKIFLGKTQSALSYHFNFAAVLPAVGITVLLAMIFLAVDIRKNFSDKIVENLHTDAPDGNSPNVKVKTKSPMVLWALKNYRMNKNAAATISMLIMVSILITIVGGAAVNFLDTMVEMQSPADISVNLYDGGFSTELQIPNGPSYGLTEKDADYLRESPDISKYISVKMHPVNRIVDKKEARDSMESSLWNSTGYLEQAKKFHYEEHIGLRMDVLAGTDAATVQLLKKQQNLQGEINDEKLKNGEEVVLCRVGEQYANYHVGDAIAMTQIVNGQRLDFSVTVGAIVDFDSENTESMEDLAFGSRMLWINDSFDKVGLHPSVNSIYLNLKDVHNTKDIDIRLKTISQNYDATRLSVEENFQVAQQQRQMSRLINVVYRLLVLAVLTFTIVSSIVSQSIRFSQQKTIFGALRAIGLTKKDLFFITLLEKAFQFLFAVAVGTVFGILLLIVFRMQMLVHWVLFPFAGFAVTLLILFATLLLAAFLPTRMLYKTSIVECLSKND